MGRLVGHPRTLLEALAIGAACGVTGVVVVTALSAATGWGSFSAEWGVVPAIMAMAVIESTGVSGE